MITILQGDVIEQLRTLPDESVHCCVTSPPYWGLRDYGTAQWEGGENGCDHRGRSQTSDASTLAEWKNGGGQRYKEETGGMPFAHECGKCGAKRIDSQIGLEKTPEEYVAKMVEVFREVRRVLRKDGTCWVNLGDAYAHGVPGAGSVFDNGRTDGRKSYEGDKVRGREKVSTLSKGLKPKDLCGIPWRVAFALQADGWWLRSDIIWAKPNPMPESVTDRPTKSHEYLFLLTKSANYFYDAEAIKEKSDQIQGARPFGGAGNGKQNLDRQDYFYKGDSGNRNKRSVWTVATAPYPEAHFATYPPDLIKPCILAGTSAKGCCAKCGSPWERIVERGREYDHETYRDGKTMDGPYAKQAEIRNGILPTCKTIGWQPTCTCACPENWIIPCTVLDPFAGSGTTGAVALELGRKAVLIELNPKYIELIKTRCNITPGLPLAV